MVKGSEQKLKGDRESDNHRCLKLHLYRSDTTQLTILIATTAREEGKVPS